MTTPAQPFALQVSMRRLQVLAKWGIPKDDVAVVEAELIAAYEAGRAEERESLRCTNEVQIPGIAQPAVNLAADHWHGLYLQQCLKNKDDAAQRAAMPESMQPAEILEFITTTYDLHNLNNWLVGHDKGVRVTHRSGAFEECHSERGFHANQALALERLQFKLSNKDFL